MYSVRPPQYASHSTESAGGLVLVETVLNRNSGKVVTKVRSVFQLPALCHYALRSRGAICYPLSPFRRIPFVLIVEVLFQQPSPPMSLNPLAPVTNYQSMLNRIFWFTSAAALIAIWMLRLYIPRLDVLLRQIDFTVGFGSDKILPMPGGYLLPALAVGIMTRVFRMHARLSDWLGIRERFDVEVIIGALAAQLSIDLTLIDEERLTINRHRIMRRAFYAFVSGPEPQIDPLLIQQALDAWSWLWIGVEAAIVFVLCGLGLIAGNVYWVGLQTIGGSLCLAAIGLPVMREQCKRYAIAQVRAIVLDSARAAVARATFAELTGHQPTARRAA
jgi:hypothetical protein